MSPFAGELARFVPVRAGSHAKYHPSESSYVSNKVFESSLAAIENRTATVGVVGLGYVGLPLVRIFLKAGFTVVGFDVDQRKVDALHAGKSYIRHIPEADVKAMLDTKRFRATADMSEMKSVQAIIVCVPTPLTINREPDMTYVESTTRAIAKTLQPGQLVVLESTTYPGTTRSVMLPILEATGLKAGKDFFVAYSPEREDPGNPNFSAANIPKVVGGLEENSHRLAVALYSPLVPTVVQVSSPEVAEACKILENTYRCVNIALVNELKILFERMDIDVWEVIRAASTKPFGFQAFYPGPGLGGHCIPIDPFYLSWVARKFHFQTKFIELAGEVNTAMPEYVISRVMKALNEHKKSVRGSKILVLGLAYKKDVDDQRESPSFELIDHLMELGAEVSYNDPYIPRVKENRKFPLDLASQELTPESLKSADCVLISTDHSAYDWEFIVKHAPLIVDSRNATVKVKAGREKIWSA
jgi:UDP-N-acetyl-D-glucosamine dehydrogenase